MASRPKTGSGGGQKPPNNGAVGTATDLLAATMTITVNDPETPHHLLSDDQLATFDELARDASRDWALFLAASALGTSQNVYSFISALAAQKELPTVFDGAMCIVFAASLVGAMLKGWEYWNNYPKLNQKIKTIRERPKIVVRNGQVQQTPQGNGSGQA
jgi:hypothetical protein